MTDTENIVQDWAQQHVLTTPSPNWSEQLVTYDKALMLSILREGTICQIGYWDTEELVDQEGKKYPPRVRVIPRQYGLYVPDPVKEPGKVPALYLHGPDLPAGPIKNHCSRLYRLINGKKVTDVCVTVNLVDGIGVARSAIHGTLAYRSVVIYGAASVVGDDKEKILALDVFSNHAVAPGYANYSRRADDKERANVGIIKIEFVHASAKVRTGEPSPPRDGDPADPEVWAGTLPITQVYGPAKTASYIDYEAPVPEFVQNLVRSGRGELRVPAAPQAPHPSVKDRPKATPLI